MNRQTSFVIIIEIHYFALFNHDNWFSTLGHTQKKDCLTFKDIKHFQMPMIFSNSVITSYI